MSQVIIVPEAVYSYPDRIRVEEVYQSYIDPRAANYSEKYVSLPGHGHDSYLSYMQWYGIRTQAGSFSDSEIRSKLWFPERDFRKQVESMISQFALVQRSGNAWKVAFSEQTCQDEFVSWFYKETKKHEFKIGPIFQETYLEMEEWLKQHTTVREVLRGHHVESNGLIVTVRVRDSEEAFHFKMRWYGVKGEG